MLAKVSSKQIKCGDFFFPSFSYTLLRADRGFGPVFNFWGEKRERKCFGRKINRKTEKASFVGLL